MSRLPAFLCPNCRFRVEGRSTQGLVCPNCGFGRPGDVEPIQPAFATPVPVVPVQVPLPTAGVQHGDGPPCPRCASTYTRPSKVPTWAIVCAVVGFFFVFLLSLLFLLAREDATCFNCGLRWSSSS